MTLLLLSDAGILGLLVGSFLNVVIWRVPRGESIVRPRSHCPRCEEPLPRRDNIPVLSWLLLRGRCRHCGEPISRRYPLVEMGTAVLFALVAGRIGLHPALPAFLYLAAVGIALALIDLDHKRLPFALTAPSYPIAGVLLVFAALVSGEPRRLIPTFAGMAALFAFYFVINLISPRAMGFGDVMLSGVLGLYLGYLGWGPLLVGAFLGFLLGSVGGVLLILAGRGGRRSQIPFGPYMLAGALVAILAGRRLADLYLRTTLG